VATSPRGSIQRKVQDQYGKQAQLYSISRTHSTGDTLQLLVDMADLSGSERVLDVATGTGFCAMAFAARVAEVTAYDLTPEMLGEAARLAAERGLINLTCRQGAAEDMPFDDRSFDVVTSRVAPHHFESMERFLAEAFRVLKAGGQLLIADTAAPDEADADLWENEVELLRDPSHVRDYTRAEWHDFVTTAGFVDVDVDFRSETHLTFNDWITRSGTPPDVVERLRGLFEGAPPAALQAFAIEHQGDDFAWHWPVAVLRASKPA
jgi:ubiquinone/menaquinone biosynthesis C-methylase UbiE